MLKRSATVGLVALAVGIIAAQLGASHVMAASQAPPANGLPSALAPYARQLSRDDDLHLTSLPAGTRLRISESAAKTTALKEFGQRLSSTVSAFAVSVTDKAFGYPQPDGTLRLKIVNRPVWVVLIPNQSMPVTSGPPVTATLAVFVTANTGAYLMAASVYPP